MTKRCFGGVSLAKGFWPQQSSPSGPPTAGGQAQMRFWQARLVEGGESSFWTANLDFENVQALGQKPICIAYSSLLIALNAGKGVASVNVSGANSI